MAKTFEDNIARLEEIVTALEKGDAKLADSLKLFEEGTKLMHDCGAGGRSRRKNRGTARAGKSQLHGERVQYGRK